jgi:hypothetical protein
VISGDRVRLRAGTLYTALDRLRADGLIDVDREEVVDNRLRRYYRLTPSGSARLAEEASRLQANAAAALTRLRLSPGRPSLPRPAASPRSRRAASPQPRPAPSGQPRPAPGVI